MIIYTEKRGDNSVSETLKVFIIVFFTVNASVILTYNLIRLRLKYDFWKKQREVNDFGKKAEKRVLTYIEENFPNATVMSDVYLKTEKGLTEIDVVMICNRGIFIIETKSHHGYINTEGKYWTQRFRDKVVRFHSPTKQNLVHKIALWNLLKKRQSLTSLPVYTVTVFTSYDVYFTENVKDVIRLSYLARYVNARPVDKRMTEETIQNVQSLIQNYMETNRRRQLLHKKKVWKNNLKKKEYQVNKYSVKNQTKK